MFYIYVLRSVSTDRFYIGSTEDLHQRLARHNAGLVVATKAYRPWELIYNEEYETRVLARRREAEIKSWKSRARMIATFKLQR